MHTLVTGGLLANRQFTDFANNLKPMVLCWRRSSRVPPVSAHLFARGPPVTKVCTKTSPCRHYTLCFCRKQYNFHLLIYSQMPVVRHFTNWCARLSILIVYDIYRIFHELQHSLAHLQHRYYDVTILIGW